jgi:GAF domain-containing protein
MQRRGSSSGQGQRQRTKSEVPKVPTARASGAARDDLLDQRTRERDEALEQLAATSEVLQVISSSPGELEPVFDAMLEKATRICEAKFGVLFRYEAGAFQAAAVQGVPPPFSEYLQGRPHRPGPGTAIDRVMKTRATIHVLDAKAELAYTKRDPLRVAAVELGGLRTLLAVPMIKENELIGIFSIYRQEVRPFTDKQIELVQNFAAQAVIVIENTRLLNELRQRTNDLSEALERQTAASDVLKIISNSPGDLQPVFNSILANATRICEAKFGTMWLREGDAVRAVALHNAPSAYEERRRRNPLFHSIDLHPKSPFRRFLETRQVVHIADLRVDEGYLAGAPTTVDIVDGAGARTGLLVPMLKGNELTGGITIYRQEVRPFTDKQIELVQNFAAQAVIAIENARLLSELRQSLEQQTATSEVLRVV